MSNPQEVEQMRNAIAANPLIESVSPTNSHIGWGSTERPVKNGDTELEVGIFDFGPGYVETAGMQILAGRSFTIDNAETDRSNSILVNEKMAASFGWTPETVVGQEVVLYDTIRYRVVGLVKDF